MGRSQTTAKGRGLGNRPPLPDDTVIVESKSDPVADALLRRRLEREIRESMGDRLRSLEVLVVDRRVVVQAKAARFWQKRALRREIQRLADLSGYRTTVNVED